MKNKSGKLTRPEHRFNPFHRFKYYYFPVNQEFSTSVFLECTISCIPQDVALIRQIIRSTKQLAEAVDIPVLNKLIFF
jgi:hypothetical protein